MNFQLRKKIIAIFALASTLYLMPTGHMSVRAQEGMGEEQAQEKEELRQMRGEAGDIKSTINSAIEQLDQLKNQMTSQANMSELHLFAKEADVELCPGTAVHCLTYNGKLPGPPIRVKEGANVKIVLHNQLGAPTSLLFHGVSAPHSVHGLPRKDQGLVRPGEAYAYQFVAKQAGTYWYHPQVINLDQKARGLYGSIIVEPKGGQSYTRDLVLMLGELATTGSAAAPRAAAGSPFGAHASSAATAVAGAAAHASGTTDWYVMNGKCAPAIPPIELRRGERIRLRVVNAGQHAIPLSMSGHRFEVVAVNGSDALEPHVFRDTITVNPSDRFDLEFTADNPGVWSLASELVEQSTNNGKFPGGLACVVRYAETPQESD